MEKLDEGGEDWQSFITLTKPLISTGIKSAVKTLQILSEEETLLGKFSVSIPNYADNLREVFLPFDLEFTYGAAIHLTIAYTLFPHGDDGSTYSKIAHSILDEMIVKGNKVAVVRKAELAHIEMLFKEFALRTEQQGLQTLTLLTPETAIDPNQSKMDEGEPSREMEGLSMEVHSLPSPSVHSNVELLDNFGISSEEFLSIMDQIDTQEFSYGMMEPMEDWQEEL